uniref:Uncharacterized protein n=1 Tax=Tanacetum cinerariifolium TaxID=118510 RepID=A0A699GKV6_TANCI|nr:hypothetical protein [Tanacetum cinerariifolium]
MDQNIDFSGSDQIQTPQYPEVHPPSQEKNLKELAEYDNSPSNDRPIFLNDNEIHSVQNEESLENSSNEIDASNSNEEKEGPPQDSDIRQLIKEECCVEVCEEQKQKMEDTILELEVKEVIEQPAERRNRSIDSLQNFRVIHKSSISLNNTSQISSIHAIAPILSTKEPGYSTSMGYENSNTTTETESDEIIKSGVEELVPILSENGVTLEDKRECDVLVYEYSSASNVCDDHSEIFSNSKDDDDISSDDDDFEDVEYVEASLSNPEIVSVEEENGVEEENVVQHEEEEEEVDLEDVFQIQDVVLHEKLLSITRLISNIEFLNDNPTPDHVLNSIPIFKESDNSLLDNFLPEFETFCDHTEETRSGNTTHADNSLLEYDLFCFEIEPDQERLINVLKNDISDESTNDPLLEEANLFLFDNLIPPGIENFANDSEVDIRFLKELLIDDSNLSHESFDSNFEDNSSVPLPPPEPPDAEFDFKPDAEEEIPVEMNDEFDDDYFPFMFDIRIFLPYLICSNMFISFLFAESEDTIFDPGISV